MKAVKLAAISFLVYVGIVAALQVGVIALLFGVFDVQPTNLEAPLLVLTTANEDGTSKDRVLARLESDGQLFVITNHWLKAWYYRALKNPNVQVTLDGDKADYLAVPVSAEERDRIRREHPFPMVFRILTGFPPRQVLRLDPRPA